MPELRNALVRNAARLADQVAFADDHRRITWRRLATRVAGAAGELGFEPETVGIFGRNGVEWVIAFLAACLAGKTIVPLPSFFSPQQVAALAEDAGISRIIVTDDRAAATPLPKPAFPLPRRESALLASVPWQVGKLVIYTSGSTGRPKGVRLFSGQHLFTARALAKAVGAREGDRYLSLLPLPMLLEIICAIIIPILVGGETRFAPGIAEQVATGRPLDLVSVFAEERPTMSVMVPQLLAQYARQLLALGERPPEELRFLAVGGAHLPAAVAAAARKAGLPVFNGYGLSECASVVALNTPRVVKPGTVGKPLPGLSVHIEEGEIVVTGPSVMDGYLHGEDTPARWHTGDLGEMDAEGFLRVLGRKDNLIVTSTGRNISPEWIEAMLLGDPKVLACALTWVEEAGLGVVVVPSVAGEKWFARADAAERRRAMLEAAAEAPEYARPRWVLTASPPEAARHELFATNGTPNRRNISSYVAERMHEIRKMENEDL